MPNIIILPTAEKTYNAVTAVQFGGRLFVFWRMYSDESINDGHFAASSSDDGLRWQVGEGSRIKHNFSELIPVPGGLVPPHPDTILKTTTPKSPFATVFNNKLYVFWLRQSWEDLLVGPSHSGEEEIAPRMIDYTSSIPAVDDGIYSSDGSVLHPSSHPDGIVFRGTNQASNIDRSDLFKSRDAVTAVQYLNSLFIFWRDELDNICYSFTMDGTGWSPSDLISTIDKTTKSPCATVFKEKLYVFWKSNDPSNHIYCSRSDIAHGLLSGRAEWAPSIHVINTVDTTAEAVTAVQFNDGLYVFWKSDDTRNHIYWSRSEDGVSWPPGEVLEFRGTAPTTPKSPFATVFNNKLYVFWIQENPARCCSDIHYNTKHFPNVPMRSAVRNGLIPEPRRNPDNPPIPR